MDKKGFCQVARFACVYMLVNPLIGEPFYVGIGNKSRPKAHFREADGGSSTRKARYIRKLRKAGVADDDMVVYLAHGLPAAAARTTEEWLVACWGRRSNRTGPLLNLTPGGERHPMEDPLSRERIIAALRRPERRRKLSLTMLELQNRPDVRAAQSARITVLHSDPEYMRKRSAGIAAAKAAGKYASKNAEIGGNQATKKKHANRMKLIWANPDLRAARTAAIIATLGSAEVKSKRSATWASSEFRQKQAAKTKSVWARRRGTAP